MQYNNKNLKKSTKNKDNFKNSLNSYAKYSGIAFQMAGVIFLGTWGGYKLDELFKLEDHILTVILSLVSVVLAIYVAVKDFLKK